MATPSESAEPTEAAVDLVDPRAPRFGQSLTAIGLVAGIALAEPAVVVAVTVVLNLAVVSGWRADLYAALWRHAMIPVVGPPTEREPAAPHRFAKLMGAGFTLVASVLLLADTALPALALGGLTVAGYVVAGLVALLAGIAAVFDVCVGCRMYQRVSFFRSLGVV